MATYDLIIKNGTVVTSEQTLEADVAVKDGKIAKFAPNLDDSADRVIDAKGKHVFPGMIDAHVHFNEPGRAEWEGLETGSKSLAKGGATAFFDMPLNSTPPVVDKKNLDIKKNLAKDNQSFMHIAGVDLFQRTLIILKNCMKTGQSVLKHLCHQVGSMTSTMQMTRHYLKGWKKSRHLAH